MVRIGIPQVALAAIGSTAAFAATQSDSGKAPPGASIGHAFGGADPAAGYYACLDMTGASPLDSDWAQTQELCRRSAYGK